MRRLHLVSALLVGLLLAHAAPAAAEIFGGIDFPAGAWSFADVVAEYQPVEDAPGSPANTDPSAALGVPDGIDVSLGNGGSITLEFTTNLLTGSGDADPDLAIFEVSDTTEATDIEVSFDGVDWTWVGSTAGGSLIDIDWAGFTPDTPLYYVRITDDAADAPAYGSDRAGADIDAIGAISTRVVGESVAVVHARECPAGAEQIYDDCHDFGIPGMTMRAVNDDNGDSYIGITDEDGDIVFEIYAGTWTIFVNLPNGWTPMNAYCAYEEALGTETYVEEFLLYPGDVLYCDIYFYGDGLVDDGVGGGDDDLITDLPETGAGPSTRADSIALLGIILIGTATIAASSRRRSRR